MTAVRVTARGTFFRKPPERLYLKVSAIPRLMANSACQHRQKFTITRRNGTPKQPMTDSHPVQPTPVAFVPPSPLQTPVLFLIFNRPDTTAIVFEAIRTARPPRLYVAADGARTNRPAEADKCRETRAITERVDWPCEVHTLFRDENLGCKRAVSSAISWFFEHEEQGIILEDDCLPSQCFFWFAETLLDRYASDERVGHISGTAFFDIELLTDVSSDYVFSRHFSVWGWATWRRVWMTYDATLAQWPKLPRERFLPAAYPQANERAARSLHNDSIVRGEVDAWGYQWIFANTSQSRLAVVPVRNLIINIGFGDDATHTRFRNPVVPTAADELMLPIKHPQLVHADFIYDDALSKRLYPGFISAKFKGLVARMRDRVFLQRQLSRVLTRVRKSVLSLI